MFGFHSSATPSPKLTGRANPDFLAVYQKQMTFRNGSAAVKTRSNEAYNTTDVMAFKRIAASEEVFVVTNIRNSSKDYSLPAAIANTTWTNALTNESITFGTSISLTPCQYLILKK